MIWAALATAIMLGSGEGDDFGSIFRFFELMREEIPAAVEDPDRRREAALALNDAEVVIHYTTIAARTFAECVETADRDYDATREDYNHCGDMYADAIDEVGRRYSASQVRFHAALQPAEITVLERRLLARIKE